MEHANKPFSLLIKPASADCNQDCAYCFYLGRRKLYPRANVKKGKEVYQFLCEKGFFYHQYIECVEFDKKGHPLPSRNSGQLQEKSGRNKKKVKSKRVRCKKQ